MTSWAPAEPYGGYWSNPHPGDYRWYVTSNPSRFGVWYYNWAGKLLQPIKVVSGSPTILKIMMLFPLPSTILFTVYHYFPSQLSSQNYAALYFYGIKIVFYFGILVLSVQKCVRCSGSAADKPDTDEGICFRNPSNKTFIDLKYENCTSRTGVRDRCITTHTTFSRNETLSYVVR